MKNGTSCFLVGQNFDVFEDGGVQLTKSKSTLCQTNSERFYWCKIRATMEKRYQCFVSRSCEGTKCELGLYLFFLKSTFGVPKLLMSRLEQQSKHDVDYFGIGKIWFRILDPRAFVKQY